MKELSVGEKRKAREIAKLILAGKTGFLGSVKRINTDAYIYRVSCLHSPHTGLLYEVAKMNREKGNVDTVIIDRVLYDIIIYNSEKMKIPDRIIQFILQFNEEVIKTAW